MIKRIRIILVLVFVSILGLVALQIFWNTKFYDINREQLVKELNLALEKSVKMEMSARYANEVSNLLPGTDTSSFIIVRDTVPQQKLDSLLRLVNKKEIGSAKFSMSVTPLQGSISGLDSIPDKIEFRLKEMIGKLLMADKTSNKQINLSRIDSLFALELQARDIELDYFLEVYDHLSGKVAVKSDRTSTNKAYLTSRNIPATLSGDKSVRVVCTNLSQVIMTQVGWGGVASALLFVLIMSCFVYMLKTIFKQKQLSQIKTDFINNMTHELKTPISTVSAIVESMQRFGVLNDRDKAMKYLDVSQNELGRLTGLVEKVLNMAREERTPMKINREEIDVREICENIINSQTIKQEEKNVKFLLDIDDEASKIHADRFHMVNVIQNLLENSIKYSGDQVTISIICKRQKEGVKLLLRDNGIGISKKHQTKVFEQFYRVPTGDVHNVKGFGLGLHYVKNIVEKHGGKVYLQSEINKGSTFTIILPD